MRDDLDTALLDALDEPALLVASERIAGANRTARALLGNDIIGQDIRFVLRQPQAIALLLGEVDGEAEIVGLAGAERPWRLTVRPLGDGRTLARLDDLAATRSAERMRVDFVANASHELRTPLATISGYAETLEEPGLEQAVRERFAATIRGEAARMLRLVEELMSLSRIEADRFQAPAERLDMALLVRAAAGDCGALAEQRGARIDLDVMPNLPTLRGDSAQLSQLVCNLVANALRYGCDGGGGQVAISLTEAAGALRLSVRDFGEGVAAEHLPRLTERFYRVDPVRSRDSGGTGLGLAIVKHIAERHRGTLSLRSAPGAGFEAIVTLPIG